MSKNILLGTVIAASIFALPSVSHAGTSCKSTWTKASSTVSKFFAPASKLVCKRLNTKDEAAAAQCLADLEEFAAKADEIKTKWNEGEDGSWKVGPRALPTDRVQTGTVSTERQFVGQPVLTDTYTLKIDRTGGKAKNDLIIKICMVDETGNDVHYKNVRINKRSTSQNVTFTGAEGTMALIHLNNEKWGTNGHKYTIKASASGEPSAVTQAKATISAAKSTSKTAPRPGNRTPRKRRGL